MSVYQKNVNVEEALKEKALLALQEYRETQSHNSGYNVIRYWDQGFYQVTNEIIEHNLGNILYGVLHAAKNGRLYMK